MKKRIKQIALITATFMLLNQIEETANIIIPQPFQWIIIIGLYLFAFSNGFE